MTKGTFRISALLLVFLMSCYSISGFADDLDPHYKFSGVKAPDSPYKNTWGAYQTDLFSGSFGYQYEIEVPPGTNGLAPELSISYNSHAAKGKAGWVGAGWEIPLNYIQRNIQYTRKDTSDDTFELYLEGAKHDLVNVPADGRYHTKVESYMKVEKKTGAPNGTPTTAYWTVTMKDGTEYRFGYSADSARMMNASDTTVPAMIWRWSLDRIKDTNGNQIFFTYTKDPTANDKGTVYLSKIEYNNDKKRVIEFLREDVDKPDMYLTIEQGSEVQEARRLREIRVSVDGQLARKYVLTYGLNETQNRSLLTLITQYGSDGVTALPPVKFEYKTLDKGFNDGVNWPTPGQKWIRNTDDDNDVVGDTFDVNGDGLPDLVEYDGSNYRWLIWFNNKNGFDSSQVTWAVPSSPDGGWDIRDVEKYIAGSQSPDTRSSPMDFDGDGYVDFLWADGSSTLRYEINTKDPNGGFTGPTQSMSLPIGCKIRNVRRPDDTDPNVYQTFIDMNGDGRPDLVNKNDNSSWHVWINTGSSFADYGIWPVFNNDGWIEDFHRTNDNTCVNAQVGVYDINGDGLPDIVDAHSGAWQIYLNTGSNFIHGGGWATAFGADINETNSSGDIKRDLLDINGDGLPDLVNPVDGWQDWEIQFNTGKAFTAKMLWHVPSEVPANGYVNNLIDKSVGRDVFDIDGDGAADLVRRIDTVSYWRVYSNQSGQADLLSKVTDTLGGTVSVSYVSSTKYANTRLPFNYWVVTSVTTNNGMTGAHALVSTTNYSYALGLYDFPSREFRGFGKVVEVRPDGSKGRHFYKQDEARKGKEYQTEVKSSVDAPYATTANVWSSTSANGVYVPRLDETDAYSYDGVADNPKVIQTLFQNYDAYGNVGLEARMGDTSVTGDETFNYKEFVYNPSLWIVDRVKHEYVSATASGPHLREKWFYYDGAGGLDTPPTVGNLTKEERYLSTGGNPVTTYEYDSSGNRIKTTDAEGHITRSEYDSTYHAFPVKSYNAKNQLTTRTYNPANGQMLTETDPNGFVTSYEYDAFGRKVKEIKPYDTSALPTTLFQYFIDGTPPESVMVSKREQPGQTGTLDVIQFVDGLGNLIQTKSEYWNTSSQAQIIKDVFYDVMGRVKKQSNPYLHAPSSAGYVTPDTTVKGTVQAYDPLGRPILTTNPDATQVSRAFNHWVVTEMDENGHQKGYLFDAFQRLIRVTENNAGASYFTNYVYSPIGELLRITDHLGHVSTLEYDTLGRKTRMVDPDLGTWVYGYDGVGNLVSQRDARGITTAFQYDELNRKKQTTYPNDGPVQFFYDEGTIGTLNKVYDSVGVVEYGYDMRLRKTLETRWIKSDSWTTGWTYDSMDRVATQTYPDGQVVTFNYNAQGKLASIPGIVTAIQYDAADHMTIKTYANGKSTSYTYDSENLRLTSLVTPGLQGLTYTYDNVGNIKTIADSIAGRTETFAYDDLDRLTQAGDSGYQRAYQYNAVGNMLTETKDGKPISYSYDSGHPHAVSGMTVPGPVVQSFVIDNGHMAAASTHVTLNNICAGSPTSYMASEDANFTGASWLPYSTAPTFTLSAARGNKTVYFKVRNSEDVSNTKSDDIQLQLGSLRVTIAPPGAASAGAQWRVDGGSWHNSGATVSNLGVGPHHISFKDMAAVGWGRPSDQGVAIEDGETATATGTYVSVPSITLLAPNGGESWPIGTTPTITWIFTENPGATVKLELLKAGSVIGVIATNVAIGANGHGSYPWPIPLATTPGRDYQIKISSTTQSSLGDTSNSTFGLTLQGQVTLGLPNGGENWTLGSTRTITWTYSGTPGSTVNLDLVKAGAVVSPIAANLPIGTGGNGSHPWKIPASLTPGAGYSVRITSNGALTDSSDNPFTLSAAPILVTAPNGGERWLVGKEHSITWTYSVNPSATVNIELLKAGSVILPIATNLPIGAGGTGAYLWTVLRSLPSGQDYTVRITTSGGFTDSSDGNFSIIHRIPLGAELLLLLDD